MAALMLVAATVVVAALYPIALDPLRSIPGPFAARFTRLWELLQLLKGHFEQVNIDLHAKYGPIARLAPGRYSISDLEASKKLYGQGSKFAKSSFYRPFGNPDQTQADLFSDTNIVRHAVHRRSLASLYSVTTLLSYESCIDNLTAVLCSQLREFVESGEAFDVFDWMQYYAFDVIGELTVGESFGMTAAGRDKSGVLAGIGKSMRYSAKFGLFSELHMWVAWLADNLHVRIPFSVVRDFVDQRIRLRRTATQPSKQGDFLTKLLRLQAADKIEESDVFNTLGANIAAGSDTTAIALSSVIYYLLTQPLCASKLRAEIAHFSARGALSDPASFQETQQMPYLQAIIKESLRIHPATGQILARVVPEGGVLISEVRIPAGTVIGVNPWVQHRNRDVYGADADSFRPERWLEADKEQLSAMESAFLAFGAGARTCIGRNISLLELAKLTPQLFRTFDFLPPVEGLPVVRETENLWFVKPSFQARVVFCR